jgi:hypothetical protein
LVNVPNKEEAMRRAFIGMVVLFVSTGSLGAEDRPLPKGHAPTFARASLDGATVTIRTPFVGYVVKETKGGAATLEVAVKEEKLRLDLKDVKAFDNRGEKVSLEKLRERLKAEAHVLVSYHGPVDPYYLEVVKEGTLVLVVPFEKQPGIPERIQEAKEE